MSDLEDNCVALNWKQVTDTRNGFYVVLSLVSDRLVLYNGCQAQGRLLQPFAARGQFIFIFEALAQMPALLVFLHHLEGPDIFVLVDKERPVRLRCPKVLHKSTPFALDFKPAWPVLLQAAIEHDLANPDVADKISDIFPAQTEEAQSISSTAVCGSWTATLSS